MSFKCANCPPCSRKANVTCAAMWAALCPPQEGHAPLLAVWAGRGQWTWEPWQLQSSFRPFMRRLDFPGHLPRTRRSCKAPADQSSALELRPQTPPMELWWPELRPGTASIKHSTHQGGGWTKAAHPALSWCLLNTKLGSFSAGSV